MSTQQSYEDKHIDARVSVLEYIAAQTTETLKDIRNDMKEMNAKIDVGFKEIRIEMNEGRKIHERDFRITFSAIIFLGIGTAGLVAHAMKWL